MARAFAAAGYRVSIAGRNEARLKACGLPYAMLDVNDSDAIARTVALYGPIDVFCANAGGATTSPALKTSAENWQDMLRLNLSSVFHCAQAAIPPMIERGWGRFIVTGSTASLKGYRHASAYAAAKHGVLGFVRSLALETAHLGVTVNVLCPGYTDTDIITDAVDQISARKGIALAEAAKVFTEPNPMHRLISPQEVAAAAVWLASDAAASVNGQAIAIDGGETA
jgi:NAD(P)-dependent dehydrogenase (short-subunit alcohol dehydrogenase family)